VTKANTFEEATRLGHMLGKSIADIMAGIEYTGDVAVSCARAFVELPMRTFPAVEEARSQLDQAVRRLAALRQSGATRHDVRTAECDWFGAEETLSLAHAAADGRLNGAVASVMPAEIMVIRVGPWSFVGWPGECFVEFALKVKETQQNCFVISVANGDLQGYLVTEQAVRERWYEAMNSLFRSPEAGMMLVDKTLELLGPA
jgi:hypothetical protein